MQQLASDCSELLCGVRSITGVEVHTQSRCGGVRLTQRQRRALEAVVRAGRRSLGRVSHRARRRGFGIGCRRVGAGTSGVPVGVSNNGQHHTGDGRHDVVEGGQYHTANGCHAKDELN